MEDSTLQWLSGPQHHYSGLSLPAPVPGTLKQLWEAQIFTKLDLRNAYNLIWMKKGDEWKVAFYTTRWHYEYIVMPYDLTNMLTVSQTFFNKIFRDLHNLYIIVYIDDILIYSATTNYYLLKKHLQNDNTGLRGRTLPLVQVVIDHKNIWKRPSVWTEVSS